MKRVERKPPPPICSLRGFSLTRGVLQQFTPRVQSQFCSAQIRIAGGRGRHCAMVGPWPPVTPPPHCPSRPTHRGEAHPDTAPAAAQLALGWK